VADISEGTASDGCDAAVHFQEAERCAMLTVYNVHLELSDAASIADVLRLKDHLKALRIDAIGLDRGDFKARTDELSFTIYGEFGPFMMKRMLEECTENIFPGSVAGLFQSA
jgi:hypothetical protein